MSDSPMKRPIRKVARVTTSPVRNYLNQHFEQVKSEIRNQQPPVVDIDEGRAWERVAELENTLAELSLHHARLLARIGDRLDESNDRIGELERLVERLADVVAAMTTDRR